MPAARDDRHAGLDHGRARQGLVAHATDGVGRGADEDDVAACADLGELRIFGQEAIARMQRVATGGHREVHDAVGVEVAADRVGADVVGLSAF